MDTTGWKNFAKVPTCPERSTGDRIRRVFRICRSRVTCVPGVTEWCLELRNFASVAAVDLSCEKSLEAALLHA